MEGDSSVDNAAGEFVFREPEPKGEDPKGDRVSIPINAAGAVDLDGMRPATIERLQSAIRNTPALTPVVSGPPVSFITRDMAAQLYGVIGSLEASLAVRVWKIPDDIAIQCFSYSAEELSALEAPTRKVIDKYISIAALKYVDELQLFLILTMMHHSKIMALRTAIAVRQESAAHARGNPTPQATNAHDDLLI